MASSGCARNLPLFSITIASTSIRRHRWSWYIDITVLDLSEGSQFQLCSNDTVADEISVVPAVIDQVVIPLIEIIIVERHWILWVTTKFLRVQCQYDGLDSSEDKFSALEMAIGWVWWKGKS